jgi:hypothetical protein
MFIDAKLLAVSAVAGVARLIAQAPDVGIDVPGLGAVANLTSTGALIYIVVRMTTKTIPDIVAAATTERDKERALREKELEERQKAREQFKCFAQQQPRPSA